MTSIEVQEPSFFKLIDLYLTFGQKCVSLNSPHVMM